MLEKIFGKKSVEAVSSISDRMTIVKSEHIPAHVAIIMDGNGRWAKRRNLPELQVIMKV